MKGNSNAGRLRSGCVVVVTNLNPKALTDGRLDDNRRWIVWGWTKDIEAQLRVRFFGSPDHLIIGQQWPNPKHTGQKNRIMCRTVMANALLLVAEPTPATEVLFMFDYFNLRP